MLILTDFVVMSKIREKLFWKGNRIICHLRWMVALSSIERVPEGKQKGRTVLKELGKNALSRLCGMQKTASLNFCTPCELS
ncbi:MAG: hypothetical protein DRI57_21870 [Deltaproteobacteria bacterium]|nr:MAG: hypothetical protein DRI57_21870 [Deltaproteobacteria bacterium]